MKLNHKISLKELDQYTGATYSDICQTDIISKILETLPNPEMPTIIRGTGIESPKTYSEMTNLKNNNIDESIRHKLWNKDVYYTNMHNM